MPDHRGIKKNEVDHQLAKLTLTGCRCPLVIDLHIGLEISRTSTLRAPYFLVGMLTIYADPRRSDLCHARLGEFIFNSFTHLRPEVRPPKV